MATRLRTRFTEAPVSYELLDAVAAASTPLAGWHDLDPLMDHIGEARIVLLGEASHGTAEYYDWRRLISARLIREKDFSLIAVEGDWPDCYRVNRYIKGYPDSGGNARDVLTAFERWPTWMWANQETARLMEWLREHNADLAAARKVGFYGLDVYSLWDSMHAVLEYLAGRDDQAFAAAQRAFECFTSFGYDAESYARAVRWAPESCEDDVVRMLAELQRNSPVFEQDEREAAFNAEQNALVAHNAETYYRTMFDGQAPSWNTRDRHMAETLDRLLDHHGPDAKAIVWEHNTHVGDARYTDMAEEGMVNVGQLAREWYGESDVFILGFASYQGSVIAADQWGDKTRVLPVPAARWGSWEHLLHESCRGDSLLLFDPAAGSDALLEPRGHRAIGVVYRPQYEAFGNYVPTVLPRRYDAVAYFDHTRALHPLNVPASFEHEVPETYPSGV